MINYLKGCEMKNVIFCLFLMFGCYDSGEEPTPVVIDEPEMFVELVINNEYRNVDNGYNYRVPSCTNNAGPCGGGIGIKVFSDNVTVSNISTTGDEYSINYIYLPVSGYFLFYLDYMLYNKGEYTGSFIIESDDPFYGDGFIINLIAEKY